jgi:hypothetical protein
MWIQTKGSHATYAMEQTWVLRGSLRVFRLLFPITWYFPTPKHSMEREKKKNSWSVPQLGKKCHLGPFIFKILFLGPWTWLRVSSGPWTWLRVLSRSRWVQTRYVCWRGAVLHVGPTFQWVIFLFIFIFISRYCSYNSLNIPKIVSFSYNLGWRLFLYKNCSSRRDLRLSSFDFFNLRSLRCSKKLNKFSAVY